MAHVVQGVECTCIAPPPQPEGPHEIHCAIEVNRRMLAAQRVQTTPAAEPPPAAPPAPAPSPLAPLVTPATDEATVTLRDATGPASDPGS